LTIRRRHASWITSIATISALCSGALAEHRDADALFETGIKLAETDPEKACEAFEASQQLDPRAGTSINIGLCRERLGQLASAWTAFKEALRRVKDPAKKQLALERIAAIEPQLSYLTISVQDVSRTTITLDGKRVDPGALGTRIPVDGGRHTIGATIAGHKKWRKTISIAASGDDKRVVVAPEVLATGPDPDVTVRTASTFTPRRKAAIMFGGLGVGAVGGGLAFGRAAQTQEHRAFQLCPDPAVSCDVATAANGSLGRARSYALYANISYGVAGALLVTGIVLWVTGGHDGNEDRVAIIPHLGEASGVDLQVRF
jgi:hypothetical protein